MQRRSRFIQAGATLIIWAGIACAMSACKAPDDPAPPTTGGGGGGGGGTTPGTGPGTSYVNSDFYLYAITSPSNIYKLHVWNDWTAPCRIHPTDVYPTTDMYCYLDIEEADAFFAGITYYGGAGTANPANDDRMGLQYNVPGGMCAYFTFAPFFYYQYPVAYGPTSIRQTIDMTAGTTTYTDVSGDGTGNDSRGIVAKATVTSLGKCSFDKSSSGGPNCCIGDYQQQIHYINPPAGVTPPADSVTKLNWGGDWGSCISGPGADPSIWPLQTTIKNVATHWPATGIYNLAGQALTSKFMFYGGGAGGGAGRKIYSTNLFSANYYQMTNPTTDYANATIWPLAFLGPNVSYSTQRSYEAVCYDHAFEVLARIRLMIRAWSKDSEFVKSAAGNPIAAGSEPNFSDQFNVDFPGWMDYTAQVAPHPGNYTNQYPMSAQ